MWKYLKMIFPRRWLSPAVESRERKLQLRRCVRFLSLILCLDNKCYHCHCHHHRFLTIGLWVCLQLWSGLAYLKANPSAAGSCSLCLRARLRIWSSIEMCAWKKAVWERERVCVWMVKLECWSVYWRETDNEVLFVLSIKISFKDIKINASFIHKEAFVFANITSLTSIF